MNKVYTRINWENYPSENTAVNESNLNKMDSALNEIDTRVVEHDTIKANVASLNNLIDDWVIDETTGVITIHKVSGEQIIFDLNIEKVPVGFSMTEDGILIMTTDDGTEFTANIGSMIPVLTFNDSDQIAVSVSGEGVNKSYTFTIKTGSITEDKLQPNFLADCRLQVGNAQTSANASKYYSEEAKKYANEAKGSAELANTDVIVDIMNQATTTWVMPDYMQDRDVPEQYYVCGIGTPEENGYSADDYNDENGYGEPYLDVRSGMVYEAIRIKDLPLTYGWVEKEQLESVQDSGSGLTEITYAEYTANKAKYDASGKAYAIPDYPSSNINTVKKKQISVVTSAGGNASLGLHSGSYMVISAVGWQNSCGEMNCLPYIEPSSGLWYIHAITNNSNNSPIADTAVTLVIYYIDTI